MDNVIRRAIGLNNIKDPTSSDFRERDLQAIAEKLATALSNNGAQFRAPGGRIVRAQTLAKSLNSRLEARFELYENSCVLSDNFQFNGEIRKGTQGETIPVGDGLLELDDGTQIFGNWDEDGNPVGEMCWTSTTSDPSVAYTGEMKKILTWQNGLKNWLISYAPHGEGEKTSVRHNDADLNKWEARKIVYAGSWVDGVPGGKGRKTFDNRTVNDGTFEDGKFVEGKIYFLTLRDGELQIDDKEGGYEGTCQDGIPHGQGWEKSWDGEKNAEVIRDGRFSNGEFISGTRTVSNAEKKSVQKWEKGKWVTDCTDIYSDGVTLTHMWWAKNEDKYIGPVQNDEPNGFGKMEYENGNLYTGPFQHGKPHGFGRMEYKNGDVYMGPFQNGKPHGKDGTFIYQNTDTYSGDFENGMQHGPGKMTWHNGDVYVGTFLKGSINGQGKIEWGKAERRGESYNGEWRNAVREGKGEYRWPDGRACAGRWKQGIFQGGTRYVFADGKVFEGSMDKDYKPSGKGTMIWPNGVRCEGHWRNGVPSGQMTITDLNGEVSKKSITMAQLNIPGLGNKSITVDPRQKIIESTHVTDNEHSIQNTELRFNYDGPTNTRNQYHGKGVIKWDDGTSCHGRWENGQLAGTPTSTYFDGRVYAGPVNNNYEPNGPEGTMALIDGTKCKGTWTDGRPAPSISMELTYPNGNVFTGLVNDLCQANGTGFIKLADGTVWSGTWKDGQPNGNLTQELAGGKLTVNADENYQAHGDGTIVLDGKTCEATWDHGVRSEKVKLIFDDVEGMEFEGQVNDQYEPEGDGAMTLPGEITCTGNWKKGKPQGDVTLTYHQADDTQIVYVGPAKSVDEKYVPHGYGEKIFPDGRSCKCTWENGNPIGIAILKGAGWRYSGPVNSECQQDGKGDMTWPGIKTLKGAGWKNGILSEDEVTVFFDAGYKYVGRLDSTHYELTKTGKFAWKEQGCEYRGEIENGLPHGQGTYTVSHKLRYEGDFVDGRMCGNGKVTRLIHKLSFSGEFNVEKTVMELAKENDIHWECITNRGDVEQGKQKVYCAWAMPNGDIYHSWFEDKEKLGLTKVDPLKGEAYLIDPTQNNVVMNQDYWSKVKWEDPGSLSDLRQ